MTRPPPTRQELLTFEEKLSAERHSRGGRLEELRAQAKLLHEANQALLQRQYASPQEEGVCAGETGEEAAGADKESGGPGAAVRSLCRISGCSTTGALISTLIPQQVGAVASVMLPECHNYKKTTSNLSFLP